MTSQTNVLISTAGPFAQLGTPVVDSCVRTSCNYVDITGEPQWVRKVSSNTSQLRKIRISDGIRIHYTIISSKVSIPSCDIVFL